MLAESGRFLGFAARRFSEDRCPQAAAALTYTSLLALVPLMTITIAMVSAFPAFQGILANAQELVFDNLVPQVGTAVKDYLERFVANAGRLTSVGLVGLLVESTRASAVVALIIAGAFVFNYVIAVERIPNDLAASIQGLELSPLVFLLSINLLFLLFGCFLDATTMLLVLVPLLMPAVRQLGIDPVHFGVVIVVNMMIGLITPPYGVLLFVINGLTGIPLRDMVREIWPFMLVLIAALLVMVLVPDIVLWLPRQFGYGQ